MLTISISKGTGEQPQLKWIEYGSDNGEWQKGRIRVNAYDLFRPIAYIVSYLKTFSCSFVYIEQHRN